VFIWHSDACCKFCLLVIRSFAWLPHYSKISKFLNTRQRLFRFL